MQKEVDGKLTGIPAPKFASGGFSGVGKRQASSDSANDVLNIHSQGLVRDKLPVTQQMMCSTF